MRLQHVEPAGGRRGNPLYQGARTPVRLAVDRPADDDGPTFHAYSTGSAEGLWGYGDDGSVTFLATGQTSTFANLDEARAATAGGLLQTLRGAAVTAAYDATDASRRLAGQRWLAVHMRLAGGVDFTTNCECGGRLVLAASDGRMAHVDSCPTCQPATGKPIAALCPVATGHRFCADPSPLLSDTEIAILAFEKRWWKQQGAKAVAIRQEFAGMSEIQYYRALNRLLDKRSALAHSPQLVRRLRNLRRHRGSSGAGVA